MLACVILEMLMTGMANSPAHPAGPIPSGTPLADITSSPGDVAGHSVNATPAKLAHRAAPPADNAPTPAASPATSSDVKKRE